MSSHLDHGSSNFSLILSLALEQATWITFVKISSGIIIWICKNGEISHTYMAQCGTGCPLAQATRTKFNKIFLISSLVSLHSWIIKDIESMKTSMMRSSGGHPTARQAERLLQIHRVCLTTRTQLHSKFVSVRKNWNFLKSSSEKKFHWEVVISYQFSNPRLIGPHVMVLAFELYGLRLIIQIPRMARRRKRLKIYEWSFKSNTFLDKNWGILNPFWGKEKKIHSIVIKSIYFQIISL